MKIHYHTHAECNVRKGQYGYDEFLHSTKVIRNGTKKRSFMLIYKPPQNTEPESEAGVRIKAGSSIYMVPIKSITAEMGTVQVFGADKAVKTFNAKMQKGGNIRQVADGFITLVKKLRIQR
jgi:hypothetical protein